MTWLILAIVILAIIEPAFFFTTILKIAAPFIVLWIIISAIRLIRTSIKESIRERGFRGLFGQHLISFGDISFDFLNKKYYTYNEGSHNNYTTNNIESNEKYHNLYGEGFARFVSEDAFRRIVSTVNLHETKRLTLICEEYTVIGRVISQKRLSEWSFTIEFDEHTNDAKYYIDTENSDSSIPDRVATEIQRNVRLQMLENR